jgi:hypothetical protein
MVVVKTVEEFRNKNENELKAFMMYQTGIYDAEIIRDTLQEFYLRLLQTKALEKYDESIATTQKGNILNYERWVCNNFCWLLPILRKKNYTSVLKIKLPKDELKEVDADDKDSSYGVLRFISELQSKDLDAGAPASIYDVVNPEVKDTPYAIDEKFKISLVEISEDQRIKENMEMFFRFIKKTLPTKKSFQIETYMRNRLKGLNSVDIGILLNVSNNMVKFIKQEAREVFEKWLEEQVVS